MVLAIEPQRNLGKGPVIRSCGGLRQLLIDAAPSLRSWLPDPGEELQLPGGHDAQDETFNVARGSDDRRPRSSTSRGPR
jgi:hypothetical protein